MVNKSLEKILEHVSDCTFIQATANPIYAAFETNVAGMSDDVSLKARLIGSGIFLAGVGIAYNQGLRYSRKKFNITEESTNKKIWLHDTLYTVGFAVASCPPLYLLSGESDPVKIAAGTGIAAGLSICLGGLYGYVADAGRELTGIKPNPRLPEKIRALPQNVKRTIAALAIVTSIAALAGVYQLSPDNEDSNIQEVSITQEK